MSSVTRRLASALLLAAALGPSLASAQDAAPSFSKEQLDQNTRSRSMASL